MEYGFKILLKGYTHKKDTTLQIENQSNDFMHLGRFGLSDNYNLIKQCKLFKSDILLYTWIWDLLSKR